MKKIITVITILISQLGNAQDVRIIYDLNGCPANPFLSASVFYMYAGIGTINAGSTFDYTSGAYSGTVNPLHPIGNNLWEICVDPFTFLSATGQTPPLSATVFNITMQFHDAAGGIITGDCSGGILRINNPLTGPMSLNPTIVNGFHNCFVGVDEIGTTGIAVKCQPNPVSSSTEFTFYNASRGKVTLEVFNILGKKVKTIVNENQAAGKHVIKWNGDSDTKSPLSNGCYFYTLNFEGKKVATNKIIIAR